MRSLGRIAVFSWLFTSILVAQTPADPWPPPGVLMPDTAGLTRPQVVERVPPRYRVAAMRAGLQGVVALSCVVEADGSVGPVRVVQSLDAASGLDDEAIAAAKLWRFTPGRKDGVAVRVLVTINIAFSISGLPPPSTWPVLFPAPSAVAVDSGDWSETTADAEGLRLRIGHPRSWSAASGAVGNRWLGLRSADGLHSVSVLLPLKAPAPVPEPLSLIQLQQFADSMKALTGTRDFQTMGVGQGQSGARWWIWQDLHVPVAKASSLPPEVGLALRDAFDSVRIWNLVTGEDARLIVVFCTVLVPRDLQPADVERELRTAAAIFSRIVRQTTIQGR